MIRNLVCFVPLLVVSLVHAQGNNDLAIVKQRLLASTVITYNVSGADMDIASYLPLITPLGTFSDLNYTPGSATGWGGFTHCSRAEEMGNTYLTPNSTYYQSPTLLKAIQSVFIDYFLTVMPTDPANWWYQMIGCGRAVGQLSLQFESYLTSAKAINATLFMDQSVWNSFTSTGTNACDIGYVHICNGLLNSNYSLVSEAFAKIASTFVYAYSPSPSNPEGPKPDGSYMQHGPQLYNGNYGASAIRTGLLTVSFAANTTFNISGSGYDTLAHVALDGCGNMILYPDLQWDVAVVGRQFTNPESQNVVGKGGDAYLLDPSVLRMAGGARADELNALADRLENPTSFPPLPDSFTVYYATDFGVFRRANYMSSVRMISSRTAGGECINAQGLQSLHMADGVQYLYKPGDPNYQNIAPTWNWELLPGTTVQRGGTNLTCETTNGNGQGTNVGGITDDGLTGLLFMQFNTTRYGQHLVATKSYFFFDGVFVNLGCGITTVPGYAVSTTLESRILNGEIHFTTNGPNGWNILAEGNHTVPLPSGDSTKLPTVLLHHNNIGYAIAADTTYSNGATLTVTNQAITGNWSSVGTYPGPPQTNNMFTAYIDHGKSPVEEGKYAYYIWPDSSLDSFQQNYASDFARYQVLSNTEDNQVVYDNVNRTLYAAVYNNNTKLTIPSNLSPTHVIDYLLLPFPAGVVVSTYVNQTSGNDTLKISFLAPDFTISSVSPSVVNLDHTYYYFVETGASFIDCDWPNCPSQFDTPKGYIGPPALKYSCFSNGTISFVNPPNPADMSPWFPRPGEARLGPPIACSFSP